MGEFGLQLYSVRDAAQANLLETVGKVADMGYQAVQFAGFFDTPAKELKRVLDSKNMHVAGSHTALDALTGDKLKETIAYNHEIGNDLVICPFLDASARSTRDDYKRTAEQFNRIGQTCHDNGLTFAYHNHNFEFDRFAGETGFDLLFGQTDPKLVKMELDCYWATFAGFEPETIISNYANRIVSLHIKDMKQESGEPRSVEIGSGTLDMKQLIQQGMSHSVEWFVVEQEQFDGDPMESAKINIDRLNKLRKGDM